MNFDARWQTVPGGPGVWKTSLLSAGYVRGPAERANAACRLKMFLLFTCLFKKKLCEAWRSGEVVKDMAFHLELAIVLWL